MPNPILGVSVLVRQGNRVLLVKRGRAPRAGDWALPGGKVNFGERLDAAARREVLEETGIAVETLKRIDLAEVVEHDTSGHPHSHHVLVVFAGTAEAGAPHAGDDAVEAAWVEPAAARRLLPLTAETGRLIAALLE
jgi:8-oxo-dGTP diphosphatase